MYPVRPLLTRMELLDHQQIKANATVERMTYEGFGEVRQAMPAARFDLTPASISGPAPQLGEHSREILLRLGYEKETSRRVVSKQGSHCQRKY